MSKNFRLCIFMYGRESVLLRSAIVDLLSDVGFPRDLLLGGLYQDGTA